MNNKNRIEMSETNLKVLEKLESLKEYGVDVVGMVALDEKDNYFMMVPGERGIEEALKVLGLLFKGLKERLGVSDEEMVDLLEVATIETKY
ncbi:hypothetical protein AB9M75_06035 [Lactobacillus sp. AN1001]